MATAKLTLAPLAPDTLPGKQHEVYEAIRKAGAIDNRALAKELKTTPSNIAQHVRKMRLRGLLPEASARSNGGQRSTARAAATPPPPPAPEPDPPAEPTDDVAYTELVNDVDEQAGKFIAQAKDRLAGIEGSIAAIDRQREELTTAAKHLEAQIKGLGEAIDSQA